MNKKVYHCALDITMNYVGGKCKTVVLWYLRKGAKRFSEKMLSLQLRSLEQDGIIEREYNRKFHVALSTSSPKKERR